MNRIKILFAVNVCSAIGFGLYSYLQSGPQTTIAELGIQAFETSPTVKAKDETESLNKVDSTAEPESKPTATTNNKQATKMAFTPPFPERFNIFQPPRRQGRAVIKTDDQTELSVELLGFINVDEPRVALAIDGLAMTIGEGETRAGVQVLSIQPPSVVLKRGRQRWQASFEN